MTRPEPKDPTWGILRSWGVVLLVGIAISGIWWVPPLVQSWRTPPISDGFGIGDAVVALRLDAGGTSYLVLVDAEGRTRSAQLGERGSGESRVVWTEAGLSTGDPGHEYLLRSDGLTRLALPGPGEFSGERQRLPVDGGFAVWSGSAEGQQLAFVDARAGRVTAVGAGSSSPALASCGGELVEAGEYGVRAVTRASRELDGFGILDDVLGLACDAEHVYGLGEISRDANSSQTVRVWDRATGERREIRVRYPEHVLDSSVGTPFVRDGRLYWAADWRLWSIRLPSGEAAAPAPVAEATVAADLGGFIGDYDPVVGGDDLVLARAGGRVYGVASKEEFVNPKRGAVHDRLDGLAIFGADVRTGERRIVLEIHDIDFPRRDLSVTSIAVDPKWADSAAAR